MTLFKDPELAKKTRDRLQSLTHAELNSFWATAFSECPDPDRALINLERWLIASSNPGTLLAHLSETPRLSRLLVDLLGASQSVADGLFQNPELASLITDPTEVVRVPSLVEIVREGRSLLQAANSYLHKLDRLRFLKQRWRLPIVVNDLAGVWAPETVWRVISDLADAVIILAKETVWEEYAFRKGIESSCPVTVVAFGKLGGGELNYSSDIDLVYVLADETDEALENHAIRFCEMFSRALADQMGRGSLYRVDLRLRPFGRAGPVAPAMKAVETYYRSHAELWESQALIRSRPVFETPETAAEVIERWSALVESQCFKRNPSEFTLSTIMDTRERIEVTSEVDDLKRGQGGIRDVEFLTQALQMLHGHAVPEVRVRGTLEAVRALGESGILSQEITNSLVEGYTFLRQLEHRCQLVDDQQTHSIPQSASGQQHLARLMGFEAWDALESELVFQRGRNRSIYAEVLSGESESPSSRDRALQRTPLSSRSLLANWFDKLPESGEFYRSLLENEGSLSRVLRLTQVVPSLLPDFAESLALTEAILSGEIEEPTQLKLPRFDKAEPKMFAVSAKWHWLHTVTAWALDLSSNSGPILCALYDEILRRLAEEISARFDIIALGSYGLLDASTESDLDVLFMCQDDDPHLETESQAQELLSAMSSLRRYGWKPNLDLRLRPEGRKGLLVRSHHGLKTYELERMEMWERFALGNARLVWGRESSIGVVTRAAYALPLTPEGLQDLVAMKKRIETERVAPQYWKRDVKLGFGGLSDIDWFVHLFEMRYPTALEVGRHITVQERLKRMFQAGLINAVELEQMLSARAHLLKLRNLLPLIGFMPDVIPENPDKLERLAGIVGKASGYHFQREHESIVKSVRTIYLDGLDRLGV